MSAATRYVCSEFAELLPSSDFVSESFIQACVIYRGFAQGLDPTTLLVGPRDLDLAYSINGSLGHPRLLIVCVPGMARDAWLVTGQAGTVFSRGA